MGNIPIDRRIIGIILLIAAGGLLAIAIFGSRRSDRLDSIAKNESAEQTAQSAASPSESRPRVQPPAFRVAFQDDSITIVVTDKNTSDAEIESLIWLLRDAVHNHMLNRIGISQTLFDERDPLMDFYVYRGVPKCALEIASQPHHHCSRSEDQAGDYSNNKADGNPTELGFIFHDGDYDHPKGLWERGAAYIPPTIDVLSTTPYAPPVISVRGTRQEQEIAAEYSDQVWAGGRKALFTTDEHAGELHIIADWLADDSARRLMKMGLQNSSTEACNAGYRKVRFSSFDDNSIYSFSLRCSVR